MIRDWPRWCALLLLGLGMLRLFSFAWHQPLWAYANQFDMARTSACIGLWPVRDNGDFKAAHLQAPLPEYQSGGPLDPVCFPSAEVVVVSTAAALEGIAGDDDSGRFPLRWLALWKAGLAAVIALFVHAGLKGFRFWQLGFSLWFAGIVCDPINLLFLGGLYTEFTALLGAWLALGSAVIVLLRFANNEVRDWWLALGLGVGVLVLGTARMQHVLHPAAILFLVAVFFWRSTGTLTTDGSRPRRTRWTLMVPAVMAALFALGFQWSNLQRDPSIANVNRVNSLFAAVLPASDEPETLIQRIGLPKHCAALNHVSWFLSRGHKPFEECPEISEYSRLRAAWALAREPQAALRMVGRGLLYSSSWRLPYVGEVAGEKFGKVPKFSLSSQLSPLGFTSLVLLWSIPLLVVPTIAWRLFRGRAVALDLLGLVLAVWVVLTWLASLLGDGYSELGRHLHLAQNALLAMWIWLPAWVAGSVSRLREASPLRRRACLVAATFALFGLFAFAFFWSRLPMATGQIRTPSGDVAVAPSFDVEGWVLAPTSVEAVRARLGSDVIVSLRLLPPDEALRRFFPAAGGTVSARFEGSLD